MKISEMIKNLQEFMEEYGDLECWYASDDEGNEYHKVYYEPSLLCVDKYDGEIHTLEDVGWIGAPIEDYDKICVVN
ncbi:MAG: hypothetical protein IJ444_02220 [Kiritimatiellae bacterium]|nr:hypothetical protein [Kiritimatiellia bacterium]